MHFWRFVTDRAGAMDGTYDWVFVTLSVLVASLGAFVALAVVRRFPKLRVQAARQGWLTLGAFAMGLGIWAMHFTGMLVFSLPVQTGFQSLATGLSAVPAVIGASIALRIMTRTSPEWWRIQLGGLSLALGIGAMHYLGMEAMRGDVVLAYHPRSPWSGSTTREKRS